MYYDWYNDWFTRKEMEKHYFLENATFTRIGKNVDGTSIKNEFDLKNKNRKTIKLNRYEQVIDYYYYVGSEATSLYTNASRKMMISRKGCLIKDEKQDILVLPVYCKNTPTYDDEGVEEIIGLNETIIYDKEFEFTNEFGYEDSGYLYIPLPNNYQELEYIEGSILGKSNVDFSYKTNDMFYYKIKLYDLELVVYENFEAFKQRILVYNNSVLNDFNYLTYKDSFQNIKIENKENIELYFESECSVFKNQFINCVIVRISVEVENVIFDEHTFVNCICDSIECLPSYEGYFKKVFPNAYIWTLDY